MYTLIYYFFMNMHENCIPVVFMSMSLLWEEVTQIHQQEDVANELYTLGSHIVSK